MAITIDGSNNTIDGISNTIEEDDLKISNAGTNGQYLQKQSGNTGGLTWAAVAEFDDTSIRKDLATLALQTAVETNRKAYNLNNSLVEQFEDDSQILTQTTVGITTEAVSPYYVADSTTNFAPGMIRVSTSPNHSPTTSSWTGGGVTDDKFAGGSNHFYASFAIDMVWDLSKAWTFRGFYNDTSGDIDPVGWDRWSILVTTDTSKNVGENIANVWQGGAYFDEGDVSTADWANHVLEGNYSTAIGCGSFSNSVRAHGTTSGTHTVDANNTHAIIGHHFNADATAGGLVVENDPTTNILTAKRLQNNSRSAVISGDNYSKLTNVPATGRALIWISTTGLGSSRYMCTTYNGGSTATYSSYVTGAQQDGGTGTLISKTQTASDARTKVSGTILYKDRVGTATLGTDLKVSFSCDNGTNWTALDATSGNYTDGGIFSTGIKTAYLKEVTCTSGTQVKYKVEWANQSNSSKSTELHGIGVNY